LLANRRKAFTSILQTGFAVSEFMHIVCLDAPSPPDYGGAIDMYYKIKALGEAGKKIILHYYDYHPGRHTAGLEPYCQAIYSYKRKSYLKSFSPSSPFIIQSRINRQLVDRLNADDHPILLEGLHCAGLVSLLNNKERIILRMHNEEAAYYKHLAKTERSLLKKIYYIVESKLIDRFQTTFDKNIKLACLSDADIAVFKGQYQFRNLFFLPCFLPWQKQKNLTGTGGYCLYHGNLAVSENKEAALWLVENVFSRINVPFVIAGKAIPATITKKAKKFPNIKLVYDPPIEEINALVRDAHIHVLPSMNRTGVKLKLLNALLNGRFCITNQHGITGSRLTNGVVVAEESSQWQAAILSLLQKEFTEQDMHERASVLAVYNNQHNAQALSEQWKRYL
jgi:hypothetical protein